jgi:hypothetical protein
VCFADAPPCAIEIARLSEFVSERGNRDNAKHVTDVLVALPSSRLGEGVTLVDTPGLGSLASRGAQETMAYLPRCDLGVVLVDSSSAFNQEDLSLIQSLYLAGIEANVVLSKADLLSEGDRARSIDYAQHQIATHLGLQLRVHSVSTVVENESMLSAWFEFEIRPLLARHRALADASTRRKIAILRESVAASLLVLRNRNEGSLANENERRAAVEVQAELNAADEAIRDAHQQILAWRDDREVLEQLACSAIARRVLDQPKENSGTSVVVEALSSVFAKRGQQAQLVALRLWENLCLVLERFVTHPSIFVSPVDTDALRERKPAGLPAFDACRLGEIGSPKRPFFARVAPRWAERSIADRLDREYGVTIGEVVTFEDQRIQCWLNEAVNETVAAYEAQVAAVREQVRRLATSPPPVAGDGNLDREQLESDLKALRSPKGGCGADVREDLLSAEPVATERILG